MDERAIMPLDRLLIVTFGAALSWLAVGGVALGANALINHLF